MNLNQQQSQLKLLIAKGKDQGYLTYHEVNDHLPDGIVDPEQIEDIISMINDMGIAVHEVAPDADTLLLMETTVNDDDDETEEAAAALKAHTRRFTLVTLRDVAQGAAVEHAYHVRFADDDGQTQLVNILVAEQQSVVSGQLIGRLHAVSNGAHVHFSLLENNQFICPEPYFTPAARASIMTLLQSTFPAEPNLQMCY